MKLAILSENADLKNLFEDIFEVVHAADPKELNADIAIVGTSLIDEEQLHLFDTTDITVFYLLENNFTETYMKRLKTVCDSLSIKLLDVNLTDEQIYDSVYLKVFGGVKKSNSNVITFMSPISNVG
ncbi:hypothetical protein, partial [Leifsonia shinshuensis]|uniref:hypothetical protein n=1 Tax=Leifsonia shinshuensis TaxID=150026 RepID=UPI0035E8E3FF